MNKNTAIATILSILALLGLMAFLILRTHAEAGFTRLATGVEYNILAKGHGPLPAAGQYLKMQVIQKYGDSILSDTRKTTPQYQKFDSTAMSKDAYAIFKNVQEGDSLVFKVLTDSAFKTKMPAFVKKGD